jgi:hypothetical protein
MSRLGKGEIEEKIKAYEHMPADLRAFQVKPYIGSYLPLSASALDEVIGRATV